MRDQGNCMHMHRKGEALIHMVRKGEEGDLAVGNKVRDLNDW